jgi:sugar (pentulose or hexulose) kinase
VVGCALGIDLGTSSLKVACLATDGHVVATEREAYPLYRDDHGAMEQDPQDWTGALTAAVRRLGTHVDLGRVSAIGLAGQLPTLTVVRDGQPVGRAVTWLDGRADAWTRTRLAGGRRARFYRRTGMPLDGRYLGPMYALHHAGEAQANDRVLSAKDFLYLWLTGRRKTDPATATGYAVWDLEGQDWSDALGRFWGIGREQLPEVVAGPDAFDPLLPGAAVMLGIPAGVPVHVGTADSLAAVLGSGALRAGTLSSVWGSSTAISLAVRAPILDRRMRYLVTPHALAGLYALETDLLATGEGLTWLGAITGEPQDRLVRAAAERPRGARGLRFAPYVAGAEQGALWRSDVAGVLQGLTTGHDAGDIARAFLEGIAFEIRRCAELLANAAGGADEVALIGGAPTAAGMARLFADVLGRDVVIVDAPSAAARGAALLTGATAVAADDPDAVRASLAPQARTAGPTDDGSAFYETLYRQHLDAFPSQARRPRHDGRQDGP